MHINTRDNDSLNDDYRNFDWNKNGNDELMERKVKSQVVNKAINKNRVKKKIFAVKK